MQNGKGSKRRPTNEQVYCENFDEIFLKKDLVSVKNSHSSILKAIERMSSYAHEQRKELDDKLNAFLKD